jgi:hypothetical protein
MSCWAGGLASRATARTLSDSDQELVGCRPAGGVAEQLGLPAWGWLAAAVGLAFWLRGPLAAMVDGPTVATWTTVFVSFSVRALPFLVLGVVVSGAIAALVPPGWLARTLPDRPLVAVPAAGLAGVARPGGECGAVPIAGRLTARGRRRPRPRCLTGAHKEPANTPPRAGRRWADWR